MSRGQRLLLSKKIKKIKKSNVAERNETYILKTATRFRGGLWALGYIAAFSEHFVCLSSSEHFPSLRSVFRPLSTDVWMPCAHVIANWSCGA